MRDCNLPSILSHMIRGSKPLAPFRARHSRQIRYAPAMIELASTTAARPWHHPGNLAGAVLLALGGAIGAFNGLLVGFLRLPSTAVTIATTYPVRIMAMGLLPAAITTHGFHRRTGSG